MRVFIYQIGLNWKLNLRSKELLVHYYVVPLVFYLFIGGVFISILPDANKTIIQVMSVFAITMGGVLGSPYPLVEFYHSDIKKAYQVGKIPLWTIAASNFISGIMHLFVMSLIIHIVLLTWHQFEYWDGFWCIFQKCGENGNGNATGFFTVDHVIRNNVPCSNAP